MPSAWFTVRRSMIVDKSFGYRIGTVIQFIRRVKALDWRSRAVLQPSESSRTQLLTLDAMRDNGYENDNNQPRAGVRMGLIN